MHVPTSLFAAVLAFVAFDQANALCKWDRCCYTNQKGPGACPPQQWHVALSGAYCEVSVCPVGCTNLNDDSLDVVTLHQTPGIIYNMASGTGVANIDNSILSDEPGTPIPMVVMNDNTPTSNTDAPVQVRDIADPAESYSRFGPKQRVVIIAIASTIGVLSPLSSNLYTPAIPAVAKDLGVSTDAINLTITSYLILQGISPTLWSVIGDNTGRRLLYLIALTVYLGSCVGLALSPNYASVLALRAVQAVGSASTTAIGASLIGDLIHVSQRGGWMGNYSAMGGAGTAFGPVLGGLFAQYTGWRGMFVFMAALAAFLLMTTAFLLPETKRDIVDDGSVPAPWYLQAPIKWLDAPKSGDCATGRTTTGKFKIDLKAPVRLLVEPECLCVVLFTGVIFAVWQATMVATATLYSERYGLSETNIGLTYISNGVGSLCGSILTGKLLDREYKRQLQRERKTQDEGNEDQQPRQQEVQHIELARIKPLMIPTVVFLISVVALGWIMEYHVHIAASITVAFFVGGLSTIIFAGFSILIVDLFKSQSFSATASMNLSRCLIASGGTAVIGPLIRAVGVGWAFTICAAVGLISCSLALAELWRGREWRAKRKAAEQL
ncbi:uncharacterized protein PgNI_02766 [Pyricularia grisea]|uniref:Major facilitator superfamily (MFS) profile domain-containing protein n=1 Tax=Pyricularia grisea TaxID=148305 RepID=A0A6P8B9Z0_PYRGI|nr:uncharacterized protein PgNI_02766 [Pyricularia grisea]TLD12492.1 hypothetical protein PgNI_02766 [Pyricularia grisea]